MRESGEKDWKRKVTFEHVRPINVIYRMFLDERKTLTLDRAAFIIAEYPPVLITLEEETRQTKLGFSMAASRHGDTPRFRFRGSVCVWTWSWRS